LTAEEKVSRRGYVKYVGGIVVVAVVAAAGYGIYEATKPTPTTPTPTTPTPTTPTPTTPTPTPTKMFEGVKLTVLAIAGGKESFSGICYHYAPIWKEKAGIDTTVIEVSYADIPVKVLQDLTTKTGAYDWFIPCSNIMGEIVAPGNVWGIDEWYNKPGFPTWSKDDNPASNAQASVWGGKYYGVPWDNDAWYLTWNMKGMDKTLRDKDKRAEFKSKFGYELNPYAWVRDKQLTWKKVRDMAEFFHGWDWNGDGSPDYGMTMGLRTGEQGSFWFYGFAGPYVVEYGPTRDKTHNLFFLDPETLEPLISSKNPGFVEAARMFKEMTKFMNPAVFTYTFAETWDEHLAKAKSMFLYQAPDTLTLVGRADKSTIRSYLMAHPTPGADSYYSLTDKRMVDKVNLVGNICGCSWHPFISKYSKHPDAAYWCAAYVGQPLEHLLTSASAYTWTGCDPGALNTDLLVDYGGKATLADFHLPGNFVDPGYPTAYYEEGDLRRGEIAIWNNLNAMDAFEDYFRIPGATAIFTSVDTHIIGELLTGAVGVEGALDRVYKDCNKIIDEYGRDKLTSMYQAMLNYGQPNSYSPKPWKWDPTLVSKDVIF